MGARELNTSGSDVRRGRVAFIDLYQQWPAYFLDSFMAVQASDLRDAGHDVVWLKGLLLHAPEQTLTALEARLQRGAPWDLLVFERLWARDLLNRLWRAAGEPPVLVTPWEPPAGWPEVTYRISPPHRETLRALVDTLVDGSTCQAANLYSRDPTDGQWRPPNTTQPLQIMEQFAPPIRFAYDLIEPFGFPPDELQRTRYLMLNMGCPYRTAANASGFLDGLDLPTEWGDAGCTFCNVGPYERQSGAVRVGLIRDQLAALAEHGPYDRLVVIDEFIFRDLDALTDAVIEHAPRGVELLVRARVDYLTSYEAELTRALKRLDGHASVTPYLIGFENFSDAELQRYNKGVTGAEALAAVQKLMAMSASWDNLNLSPSQGFILFGPWTTLEDLEANAAALSMLDFRKLRGGLLGSKLRLNPDAALVAKADADGLLLTTHTRRDEDNATQTGYQAELPYRFADPETARVWALLNGPQRIPDHGDDVARLRDAITRVRAS